jgi:hypothetical protein
LTPSRESCNVRTSMSDVFESLDELKRTNELRSELRKQKPDQWPQEIQDIVSVVVLELQQARALHPKFHSAHEGYAVILEELDELWHECKQRNPSKTRMMEESTQVAAMAIRFAIDVVRNG